jgi:mannose-1-phosphate guanylyltransferase
VIPQPENRGTAAGILLPLLRIAGRDPEARLVILPSDHGVSSEETLHSAITEAISLSTCSKLDLVLLGVRPDGPETGYGWIVPRPGGQGRLSPVASFHEKPDALTAAALLAQGGLLNSLILIAGARFLLALFETVLPPLWRVMQPLLGKTRDGLRFEPDLVGLYRSVPSFDFSKDVLELVAPDLWVQPVPECGWLDLGTPERLTGHLFRQGRPSRGEPAPGEKPWPPQMPHSHSVTLETTEPTVGAVAHAVA